jgi:N-acetylgalactosamine-6-sulfatase
MMNRRNFLRSVPAAFSSVAWPNLLFGHQASGRAKPPNILFILFDDLGWGDLGCYGNRSIKTPNLDRFARQGALFSQFYVSAPVCSPSRCGFLTGNFPARHRIHDYLAALAVQAKKGMPNWLDPSATTLPRLLQQAGYATAHFGKWHLGSGPGAPEPKAYGFDAYRTHNGNGPKWNEQEEYFRAKSTGYIVDETLQFIQQHPNQPFFVDVWTLLPHATLDPTPEQMQLYARYHAPDSRYPGAMQIYYSTVTALDEGIGRLLAKLDEMGLAGDTLVLVSSDNGPEDIHVANASVRFRQACMTPPTHNW